MPDQNSYFQYPYANPSGYFPPQGGQAGGGGTDPREAMAAQFMKTIQALYAQAQLAQLAKSQASASNPPSAQLTPSLQQADASKQSQQAQQQGSHQSVQQQMLGQLLQNAMQQQGGGGSQIPSPQDAQSVLTAHDPFQGQQAVAVGTPQQQGPQAAQGSDPTKSNAFLNFLMDRMNVQRGLGYAGQGQQGVSSAGNQQGV